MKKAISATIKAARWAILCGAVSLATMPSVATAAGDTTAARGYGHRSHASPRQAGPLAPAAIERMHAEAEDAYRARRWSDAMQGFNAIVVLEPDHARAWLRIGNLHHRRNQLLSAASAYRKAAQRAARRERDGGAQDPNARSKPGTIPGQQQAAQEALPGAIDPYDIFGVRRDAGVRTEPANPGQRDDIRSKALINLALVNVELAQSALAELGEVPADLVDARDEAAASVRRVRGEVERRRGGESGAARAPRTSVANPGSAGSSQPQIDYLDGAPIP